MLWLLDRAAQLTNRPIAGNGRRIRPDRTESRCKCYWPLELGLRESGEGCFVATNLLAQLGDYVNAGVNTVSLVDADSFWVDGYFEETNLAPIRVGDPAQIKLMRRDQIVRGHVDSIARAINVANAQPNASQVNAGLFERFLPPPT
jgi:hypothetical protein